MDQNDHTSWLKTDAGQHLQESLSNERVLQGIDHLLNRIATLEKAVDNLSTVMEIGPGMVSMVTDIADESIQKAAKQGIEIEERLSNALKIAEKITASEMMEKLDGLFDFLDKAPGILSMSMDMVDEGFRLSSKRGIDIEQRFANALHIAEKLTDPTMVKKLDNLLKMADQAPGLIAMTMDTIDEEMKQLIASGVDFNELVSLLKQFVVASKKANDMPHVKVKGVFSMMKIMKDPNRQKAIGHVMNIAKAWGQKMD